MCETSAYKGKLLNRRSIDARKAFVCIFFFLLAGFLLFLEDGDIYFDDFFLFSLTYKTLGFVPKIFFGSVLSLFTDFVSMQFLNNLYVIQAILFISLISFALSKCIQKCADKEENDSIVFVLIALLAGSVSVMYSLISFPLDLHLVSYFLLSVLVIRNKYLKFLIPAFLFCAIATHHAFSFAYMPAIAIVLLINIYFSKNKKSDIILFAVSFFVMATASCYFFLFHQLFRDLMKVNTLEGISALVEARSDVEPPEFFINVYFILKPFELIDMFLVDIYKDGYFFEMLRLLVQSLPFFISFGYIWHNMRKRVNDKFLKFIYLCAFLFPLAYLPLYVISTNHQTNLSAGIMCEVAILLLLFYMDEKNLRDYIHDLHLKIRQRKWLQYILITTVILWSIFMFNPEGLGIILFR